MAERELVAPEDVPGLVERNRWYWLQLLKAGPNRDQDDETVERLQLAHLQHLFSLQRDGKLTLFGPVDDPELRGIGVLLVETREEAEALMADDAMVLAGRLVVEVRPWFTQPGVALPEGGTKPPDGV